MAITAAGFGCERRRRAGPNPRAETRRAPLGYQRLGNRVCKLLVNSQSLFAGLGSRPNG